MNLKESIDNLYTVFSGYIIRGNLRYRSCECCVSDEEIKLLLSKPLKELSANDLNHFMASAITTFGGVEDYKHFLPRILELIVDNSDVVDDFLTYEKLNYSEWLNWNTEEIVALKSFFEALLINALDKDFEIIDDSISLNLIYNNYERLTEILQNSDSKILLQKIVDEVFNDCYWKVDKELLNIYASKKIVKKVEQLYFKTKDKMELNKIAIAYSILENHNENRNTK
ncbi:hypothetical protein Q4Q39_06955 [Flavivirga amylovorans]|uniref:Uncharacterized protein n=1 Tax=Flavivirga amylovorans TaxID=870486 RepID=A0ABT8X0K7_9FLAO|nr:hypothetical protein [Flavivirga amylovorans]MDO5987130.1 hypothetical protein [Flavivirga amylovorans]